MIVGYIRVSHRRQAEEGLSLRVQEEQIRNYAKAFDLEVAKVYVDRAQSGKSLQRPKLTEALERIEIGEADGLIITKLDRLTRSIADLSHLLATYFRPDSEHQATLHSVHEKIDTSSASGRMLLNVIATVAEWERDTIAERISAVKADQRRRGEYMGGTIPFGFTLKNNKVVSNPQEQKTVKRILKLRTQGNSLRDIVASLKKTKTPSRGKAWSPSAVSRIIKNYEDQ